MPAHPGPRYAQRLAVLAAALRAALPEDSYARLRRARGQPAAKRKSRPLPASVRRAECASRKKSPRFTGAVFVLAAYTVDSPQENACGYGALVSEATIFSYVEGNPLSFADPEGLQSKFGRSAGSTSGMSAPRPIDRTEPHGPAYTPQWTLPPLQLPPSMSVPLDIAEIIIEMAAGGKQQGRNWATEEAKRKAQENGTDPCTELAKMLEDAKCKADTKIIRDIQQAEKFMHCRNVRKRNSHY